MELRELLNQEFLWNPVSSYCWFAGIILTGFLFKKIISVFLSKLLFKAFKGVSLGVGVDDFLSLLTKPTSTFLMLITIYLAFDRLEFPNHWQLVPPDKMGVRMIIFRTFYIAIIISLTWIVLRIVDFFGMILMYKASLTESKEDDMLVPFLKESLKIVISIFSFFFLLGAVFNVNIASLIAGLGIGGLAFALAAKESLENLLGSFTIFFDKPFSVGDLVHVGNIQGVVEKIGFRSTQIRTVEKSIVTVPNKKMVDAELENLTSRMQRRSLITVGLTYATTAEQIKTIMADIKAVVDSIEEIEKKDTRVYLHTLNSSSIDIQVLFLVNTSNNDVFLVTKERVSFEIMNIVTKNNAAFAYPSTSVYIEERIKQYEDK